MSDGEDRALRCYSTDYEHVIAYDELDALAVLTEHYGAGSYNDPEDRPDFSVCDGGAALGIFMDEGRAQSKVTKTIREWIASHGRGLLCSTEY